MTLLGKQAWRLTTNDECLTAKVMKGIYYPNSDFMDAGLGYNPSNTWRGILEAKEVLLLGARKRIRDGLHKYVWKDPWISTSQYGRVISPRRDSREELLVNERFAEHEKGWCREKISYLFLPFEQERILIIEH
ncbi:hypothetical protein RND81_03G017800 [Saponaria officinalis]|uniref:Uncharacterized protein n=1 Tax=Saponaria officinalis TaxID=3572 RepID=A0AAW1M2Q6_SAPOF